MSKFDEEQFEGLSLKDIAEVVNGKLHSLQSQLEAKDEEIHLLRMRLDAIHRAQAYSAPNSGVQTQLVASQLDEAMRRIEAKEKEIAELKEKADTRGFELEIQWLQQDLEAERAKNVEFQEIKRDLIKGHRELELCIDIEQRKNASLTASLKIASEALESADLVITQGLYVGSMTAPDYETWQGNCQTCWNELREALAQIRGENG